MIRKATMRDVKKVNELRKVVNDIHVEGRPDIFKPGFCLELQDHVMNYIDQENNEILLAEQDGEIRGMVMLDWIDRPGSPYNLARRFCHVAEIAVDERFRRMGVGKELMEGAKAECRKRGIRRIELDVWSFNDALAFYEAEGFTVFRRFMEYEVEDA